MYEEHEQGRMIDLVNKRGTKMLGTKIFLMHLVLVLLPVANKCENGVANTVNHTVNTESSMAKSPKPVANLAQNTTKDSVAINGNKETNTNKTSAGEFFK